MAAAAAELGARLVFVRGSARDDPQAAAASASAIAAALPGGPDGMVQVAVGPAGVHSDGPETFALLGEVAARHGLRRRTQAGEQVDVEVAAQRYGRRPLELLDEWGWLAPDVTLAHLCGVTGAEVAAAWRRRGVTATHAPGCDLPMGWGVAPMAALSDAGVRGRAGDERRWQQRRRAPARRRPARAAGGPARRASGERGRGAGLGDVGGAAGLGPSRARAADARLGGRPRLLGRHAASPTRGAPTRWPGCCGPSPGRRPRHVVVGGRVVVRDGELVARPEREVAAALRALLGTRPPR